MLVRVGFTDALCAKDLSVRPYIILKNKATGQGYTIYGGTTHRSIDYVALQNKDDYSESTDANRVIWGIIHSAYLGDTMFADNRKMIRINKTASTLIASLLAFVLAFGAVPVSAVLSGAAKAYAQEGQMALASTGTSELLYNGYPVYQGSAKVEVGYGGAPNKESTFYFSEGYFAQDPSVDNEHMATFSLVAASTAMSEASDDAKSFFGYLGATNVKTHDIGTSSTDTIGALVATKTLFAGTADECPLVCVLVRGGGYDEEWENNFEVGESGDHKGLSQSSSKIVTFVNNYITSNSIDTSKAKIWIAGYSRGGAVSNLAGKTLSDSYSKSQVYSYCFEPPMATVASGTAATSYSNIHVYCNVNDIVTYVAPAYLGFGYYGKVHKFADTTKADFSSQEAKMLEHFALLNKNFSKYISPSSFAWKRIDVSSVIGSLSTGNYYSNPKKTYSGGLGALYELLLARIGEKAAPTRTAYSTVIPSDVQAAADAMGVSALTFEEAFGKLLTIYFTTSSSVQDAYVDNLGEFPGNCASETLKLIDYLEDMKIVALFSSIKDYKSLVSALWSCFYNGSGSFKSLSACGLSSVQIDELKTALTSALYYIACYTSVDIGNDQQTIGTLAYNVDLIVESHCSETNLAWLRSFDSYYATDTSAAFIQTKTQYETYIYASNGSSLAGTTITVKKPDGTTIATIVDGAVGNSQKSSFDSSCVKLRGTGNEVSIVTLASAGTCTVTVQADNKTEATSAYVQIKRRNVNVMTEGSIVDSNGASVAGVDYAVHKDAYISASVAAAKTTVSRIEALPSYDMSGVTFENAEYVYDGSSHSIAISGNLPDGVTVEYQGNNVSEGGVHTVTAVFTGDPKTHKPIANMLATITIKPADNTVSNLSITGWTYGQKANSPSATATYGANTIVYTYAEKENGTFTADIPVNAGTWWVKASVPATDSWKGAEAKKSFTISQAGNAVSNLSITGWTYGQDANAPSATATFGASTIAYTYSNAENGAYTSTVPTTAGTWWVKGSVAATDNYAGAEAKKSFTIAKAGNAVSNLSITGWTYGQAANAPTASASFGQILYTYSSAENGTYTSTVPTTAGTWWVKASVAETANYAGAEAKKSFTISQVGNTVSNLSITGWTYGQAANAPSATATYGASTIAYTYSNAENGTYTSTVPTNAGTWWVKASVTATANYAGAEAKKSFTISQASNAVSNLSITGWTYGQAANAPTASASFGQILYTYSSAENGTYTSTVPTTAGTWWVKASVAETANYAGAEAKKSFTIAKADYDMAGVAFNSKTVTFDGSPQSIEISGTLPKGVQVSYTGNPKTAVGVYTITAHFTGDADNYNAISDKTATLTIKANVTPNKAAFDLSGISNPGTIIYIDGIAKTMTVSGNAGTVVLDDANAKVATLYTYNKSEGDTHTIYPTNMYVWTLSGSAGQEYTVTRQSGLDNILQYAGTSIRLTGKKGIRMITALPLDVKNALASDAGYQGWLLQEYGTVTQFDETLKGADVLLTNTDFKNYAYKRGVADPVYALTASKTKYTNVLVGFTDAQCAKDLSMRPYIILKNKATGQEYTIYGGTTHRSIGYVALQNKDDYSESTDAGRFIWGIIRSVYGYTYG